MSKGKSATQLKTDELLAQLKASALHETVPDGYTAIAEIADAVGLTAHTVGSRLRQAGVDRVKVRGTTGPFYAYENAGTLAAFSDAN